MATAASHERVGVQVGGRAAAGEDVALVGGGEVGGVGLVGRGDGDAGHALGRRGAGDADGDLSAVGDQQAGRVGHPAMLARRADDAVTVVTG